MKSYSIPDLLVGQTYYPRSLARKHNSGEINYAEKRDNVYLAEGYTAYVVRYQPQFDLGYRWATIAIKVAD
jgi:hypothetical protein